MKNSTAGKKYENHLEPIPVDIANTVIPKDLLPDNHER
jgi:hypothetical protein